jgi:hypothetical protein
MLISKTGEMPAVEINGFQVRDSVSVRGAVLKIRGAGILRWLFFNVYVAALYLPTDVPSRNVLDDVPKVMEFHYFSDMKAEQFAESGEHLLLRNVSTEELKRISIKLNEINAMYRDVKKGDSYSLRYVPGSGTELALNGEVLGRISGYDFAAVYYRIWLGDNPVDKDLKSKLLNSNANVLTIK